MEVTVSDIYNAIDADELDAMRFEDDIRRMQKQAEVNRLASNDMGYWLDNCGDSKWYCDHCLQKDECLKRMV